MESCGAGVPRRSVLRGVVDSAGKRRLRLAGSLITVTSVTFSLRVVTLQLASSQFSPRLLRTFSSDRFVQSTLALFLGTFTFSMTVLRTVRTGSDAEAVFVPQVSVTTAFVLLGRRRGRLGRLDRPDSRQLAGPGHSGRRGLAARPRPVRPGRPAPAPGTGGPVNSDRCGADRRAGHHLRASPVDPRCHQGVSTRIHDPTTAVHTLGHASSLLCEMVERTSDRRCCGTRATSFGWCSTGPDFADLLELVVQQPRRYGPPILRC